MKDDNDGVTAMTDLPSAAAPQPPAKRKRGLESLSDMVRSLGIVLLIVFGIWFFAQAPASDKKTERDINPAADLRSFSQVVPGAPIPEVLPGGWRATVSAYEAEPDRLRIGYLTAGNHYLEYDAVTGPSATFVADLTDRAAVLRTLDIGGRPWALVQDSSGRQSLVRTVGQLTVIVGSLRSNATLGELTALVTSLRPTF